MAGVIITVLCIRACVAGLFKYHRRQRKFVGGSRFIPAALDRSELVPLGVRVHVSDRAQCAGYETEDLGKTPLLRATDMSRTAVQVVVVLDCRVEQESVQQLDRSEVTIGVLVADFNEELKA